MTRWAFGALSFVFVGLCMRTQAATCVGEAAGSADYDRAVSVVLQLPELKAWSKSHSFPVAFMPIVDRQEQLGTRCFWSVTVYASRPERNERWNTFFVEAGGRRVMVSNLEGEPVPLKQWRMEHGR